ncbi:hypothetical protein BDV93DRAFT_529373 [Ceratobasidium sp. AG-I]|nr:hypothetical protein BDV93DRAFT_529373 [Ceratobasidium sp. AG-I]
MNFPVPARSAHGCLTCKRRRKKCDETKPFCERCTSGGFPCLGYVSSVSSRKLPDAATSLTTTPKHHLEWHYADELPPLSRSNSSYYLHQKAPTPSRSGFVATQVGLASSVALYHSPERTGIIPQDVSTDPATTTEMISLIMSNCVRIAQVSLFRPFPIEENLTLRVHSSKVACWTMFLIAKIGYTVLNGLERQTYQEWVDRFYYQIRESTASLELDNSELIMRLSGLNDLQFCALMLWGSFKGYSMFRSSAPLFLQVALNYPENYSHNFDISIYNTLYHGEFVLRQFVFFDTVSALAFGTTPLISYDTAPGPTRSEGSGFALEWIYGCPSHIILLMAKINTWRTSGWTQHRSTYEEWRDIEKMLQDWSPDIDPKDDSSNVVGRLAVHECWRHATFIYLYMGMCNVDSTDPRVQMSVRQIVRLINVIELSGSLERHALIPYLIAGIAARQETHRATICSKVSAANGQKAWIFRGDEFVPVLDHLWRGAGSGGSPTTWDDYVSSRRNALPLDGS